MDELISASIKIGIDEKWSKDHTYAYYGGFITFRNVDTIYVIKESTAVTKYLEYHGFTKNENAFGQMINHEDYERFLEKEGPDGMNVRKLSAFLFDKEFRQKWEKITTIEELREYLTELIEHSPYFRPQDNHFQNTPWGEFAQEQYTQSKGHKR